MTNSVLIHYKRTLDNLNVINSLGLFFTDTNEELDVIVDDVPYTHSDGYYQDPDEQLCEHYGLDYNQVNCIEAL
tara:strand:+ start:302 stop:523 length:222 start_codon:yes stop_codon:yes gene_type:complete